MVLVALSIILLPLLRKNDILFDEDLDQRNIKIARDRLAELKANKASGGINQAQFDEQVAELEMALSDDLDLTKPTVNKENQGRWLAYLLIVAVPALSFALYWILGDYQAITRVNDPNQAGQTGQDNAAMPSPEAINQMVAKLAEKLKNEPDNLEGWLMLGRSYKVLERYPEAVEAFSHAHQLAGDKVEVMLPYAEVVALSKGGNWGGKPYELIAKSLSIEPDNPTGLWFAAIANAQQGDKKTAVDFLRKLETRLPADSPDKQQIHEIIQNTERLTGTLPPENPQKPAENSASPINIQVSLAKQLESDIKPDDTVFVYAQALSGPKMPLAIVRKKAVEIPFSVSLSDAESMLPTMKLSSFKEVRLLARISKSGDPMPKPGDLVGSVERADLAKEAEYSIVINDRIK